MRISRECFLHVCHPGIVVQILSSRRIFFFSSVGLCSRMYWHGIAAAAAAAAAAFRGGRVLPASWRRRFPDARLKIHLRFNVVRILWSLLVIFHSRLWRFATQIIEVFFLFAQWWTVIHNSRLITIHPRRSEIFNDGTCAGGWFWIHARNFSLVTSVNHFVNDCPNFYCLKFHTWDRSCEISPGCTCTLGCGGCPSMQQSGLSLLYVFVCLLYDLLSFIPFPLSALSSGINIAWDERSFVCASRFPETCVSERQISRFFWTIRNSRFPKCADQNHIRSSFFFLVLPAFLSHRYAVARDQTTCACFHLLKNRWKSFLEILSSEPILAWSCNKVQNAVPSLQNQYNWICFCLRCLGFSPILLPHRIFLLGGVSFNNLSLANKQWFSSRHVSWTSLFNMRMINEVSLNRQFLQIFCFTFLVFRSKLFPFAVRFSAEILSLYGGFPSQSGFLEFVVSSW